MAAAQMGKLIYLFRNLPHFLIYGRYILCNDVLNEGKIYLIGSQLHWILQKEKNYLMQNCVSFRMENDTKQDLLNSRHGYQSGKSDLLMAMENVSLGGR